VQLIVLIIAGGMMLQLVIDDLATVLAKLKPTAFQLTLEDATATGVCRAQLNFKTYSM
jgi:hypothetical protein